MKTKKILLVIAATLIVGVFRVDAQPPAWVIEKRAEILEKHAEMLEKRALAVVEKRIGSTVYELDTVNYTLNNKANKLTYVSSAEVSLDQSEHARKAQQEHFKPLFSKERAQEIKTMIMLACVCDSTGLIQEVTMSFRTREFFEMFTLSEIKVLEDAAKQYRFNFLAWRGGEGTKYAKVTLFFSPYLLYFERPK